MDLLVDIGNSRIKWASLTVGAFEPLGSAPRPREGLADFATEQWGNLSVPETVWAANVAGPAAAKALAAWVSQHWARDIKFVESQPAGWGVTNAYREPKRLGVDRWAKLVAARQMFSGPVFIVDCGTAMTLDLLFGDGRHQGGLIVPGLQLMRKALVDRAPGIRLDGKQMRSGEDSLLARDTAGAVNGGTLYAAVAVIDRVVRDLESTLGGPVAKVITGGDASTLLPLLADTFECHPNLVLQGLATMATQKP